MNEPRISFKDKRRAAPVWVFAWKPLGRPWSARLLPILLVASGFALIVMTVRIQVIPPKPWSARAASWIHASHDEQGMALAMRARDGGPFPSRFELRNWAGAADLESAVRAAADWSPRPYVPVLRGLADDDVKSDLRLAALAEPVFPKRKEEVAAVTSAVELHPVPQLRVLSAGVVSNPLPNFDGAVAASMTADEWKFLLQLDGAGNVSECVSLSGSDDAGLAAVVGWLRSVSFKPDLKKRGRWVAVSVAFIYQAKEALQP